MPNRTISLDEKSAIIASRMPNFSAWVRRELLNYARNADSEHNMSMEGAHVAPPEARIWGPLKDLCNPRHKKGMCKTCWGDE